MAAKVKKGDQVIVIAGRDKGKKGEVVSVRPEDNRLVVQGVNMVTRHTRPSMNSQGGLIKQEATIHVSNVAHVDPKDNKATRIGFKTVKDRKVRVARRSGEAID